MSLYREYLENYLKGLDIEARRVADVGGSANPVRGRVASWRVDDYILIDNEAEKPYHEKWNTPNVELDINKDCTPQISMIEPFDIVFCLEVFEYVIDPITAINNLYELLRVGGVLYISFPSIYPYHEPIQEDCLRYTISAVHRLLNRFIIETEIARKASKGLNSLAEFYSKEGMHPAKMTDKPYDLGYIIEAIKI